MPASLLRRVIWALLAGVMILTGVSAQSPKRTVISGQRYPRMIIRNAMVVDGNGTPAAGPKDIVIEGNTIADIVPLDPVALKRGEAGRPAAAAEIDATGKYVLP